MSGVSMQHKTEVENKFEVQESPSLNQGGDHAAETKKSYRGWMTTAIVLLLVAVVLTYGIVSRIRAKAALSTDTAKLAVPSVAVVAPKQSTPAQEIILPGNVE